MGCTPLFLKAEPQIHTTISLAKVLILKPEFISSSDKSPSFKYFSINSSEASATLSSISSLYFSAFSKRPSGMSFSSYERPLSSPSQYKAFILIKSIIPEKSSSAPIGN